jgi:hypothetical protein
MGIKHYLQKKKKAYWRIAILNDGTPSPWFCDYLIPVPKEVYSMFTLQELLEIEADREIIWIEILQMLAEMD